MLDTTTWHHSLRGLAPAAAAALMIRRRDPQFVCGYTHLLSLCVGFAGRAGFEKSGETYVLAHNAADVARAIELSTEPLPMVTSQLMPLPKASVAAPVVAAGDSDHNGQKATTAKPPSGDGLGSTLLPETNLTATRATRVRSHTARCGALSTVL